MNALGRTCVVNVSWLNMRASPGGQVLDVLKKGTELTISGHTGGWAEVTINGIRGVVASRYITILHLTEQDPAEKNETQTTRLGEITAGRLNLRDSPNGHIMTVLTRGTLVEILSRKNGWTQICANRQTGYVSSSFIRPGKVSTRRQTPAATMVTGFKFDGKKAVAPDGTVFGKKFRKGIFNYGETAISDFLPQIDTETRNTLKSGLRVMDAVSENEGKFEAVNTWDNAFLSLGIFQWTAGVGSDAGELAALLLDFKDRSPEEFNQCFGQFGIKPYGVKHTKGSVPRGYLKLNGRLLADSESKNQLRALPWAYRFWSAGKNQAFRLSQIAHALSRIHAFYRVENRSIRGRYVSDYISSEYGVAQLLDQHVNRPAHVPRILAAALESLEQEMDIDRPENWGNEEEKKLISVYLESREKTSMTDSAERAKRIQKKMNMGAVSDRRGSFVI